MRIEGPADMAKSATKDIRVCALVDPHYPPRFGGGARFPRTLAGKLLQQPGLEIVHVTTNPGGWTARREQQGRLRVVRLPALGVGGMRAEVYSYLATGAAFVALCGSQFDVVHAIGAFPYAWGGLLAAYGRGMRTAVTMNQFLADDPGAIGRRRLGWLQLGIFSSADRIISISSLLTRSYRAAGLPEGKLAQIHNGVDEDAFRPVSLAAKRTLRSRLGWPADRPVAVFSGSVIRRKGVDLLVEAWAELRAGLGAGCPLLVLVGPTAVPSIPGNDRFIQWVRQRVRELGLGPFIRFTGAVDDVAPYLQAADLFAFPSRSEGMPSALLEAMACGLPSVATAGSGAADLIRHGENGYLAQAESASAIAVGIRALVDDAALGRRLGLMARETILAEATLDVCAMRHRRLYQELLDR